MKNDEKFTAHKAIEDSRDIKSHGCHIVADLTNKRFFPKIKQFILLLTALFTRHCLLGKHNINFS